MKKYNIIITVILCTLLSSCNSFLDTVPDNRTILDTPETIQELLVSAYPQAHYFHMCETMSDNAGERNVTSTHSRSTLNTQMYNWEDGTNTGQDNPVYVWTNYYEAIAAANMALEAIEEAGDTEEYSVLKGEALVCRAFCHFILVNIFAEHYDPATASEMLGIPYNTEPEKKVIVYYSREKLDKVYELIEEDLLKGLPLLRDESYKVPKYHFTKAAANAFASRYYLYTGEWEKVVKHASLALGDNPRGKMRILRLPPFNQPDKDVYQRNYMGTDQSSPLLRVACTSWWARDHASTSLQFALTRPILFNLLTDTTICGTTGTSATYYVFSTYTSQDAAQMRKFEELFKYSYAGASTGTGTTIGALLSVEEVLLNRAEAYVMLNQFDKALEDINLLLSERIAINKNTPDIDFTPYKVNLEKIKKYYEQTFWNKKNENYGQLKYPDLEPFYVSQISKDQMSMLKCIVDWRRKEFLQEGMRWFDIKRFHIPVVHTFPMTNKETIVLTKDDKRRAVQIPSEAQGFGVEPNPR